MLNQPPPAPVATGDAATARTSVWWDIENCHVPKWGDPDAIAVNIARALEAAGFRGPVTISAYGDARNVPLRVSKAMYSSGITLNHISSGVKDACDMKILTDMILWAIDHPPPGNILLISGDRDFSGALHQLRLRRYNIIVAQPVSNSPSLAAAANYLWKWTDLVMGAPGLSPLKDYTSELYSPDIKYQHLGANPQNTDSGPENESESTFFSHLLETPRNMGGKVPSLHHNDSTVEISRQRHLDFTPGTEESTLEHESTVTDFDLDFTLPPNPREEMKTKDRVTNQLNKRRKEEEGRRKARVEPNIEQVRSIIMKKRRKGMRARELEVLKKELYKIDDKQTPRSERQTKDYHMCSLCKSYHPGKPCYEATGACFICCQCDHEIHTCPSINPEVLIHLRGIKQ